MHLADTTTRFHLQEHRVAYNGDPCNSVETARAYDRIVARDQLLYPMQRVVQLLLPHCKEGMFALNLGSETGILALMLGARCPNAHICGIDDNPFFVQVAEENAQLAFLSRSPALVEFRCEPFEHLPFPDESVDIVFTNNSLYRAKNPALVIEECARVCKKDGLVLLYELVRDADPEKLRFVGQWLRDGQKEFMRTVNACYSIAELQSLLHLAGLDHWRITREQLSVSVASQDITPGSVAL